MTLHTDPFAPAGLPDTDLPCPTAHLIDHMALYGYRPFDDDPDPRSLPEPEAAEAAVDAIFATLQGLVRDTRLEHDFPDLAWALVNLFHRKLDRVTRELDDNEQAQRRSQDEQDGSEVRSVELERLVAQGVALIERRDMFESLRERAADLHEATTGSPWIPRSGSLVNHRALTAAMIDSRDFLNAKRRAEAQLLIPTGTRVAVGGGPEFEDVDRIWRTLDKVHAKYPDMVLLHGGSPKGAEHVARLWARARRITELAFKPDWARHRNAAPFKRNDALLETMPVGVLVFPGNGVTANLADKARKLGIPVMRFD